MEHTLDCFVIGGLTMAARPPTYGFLSLPMYSHFPEMGKFIKKNLVAEFYY